MAKSVHPVDQPNQSADRRYYASGQRSVITPSLADAPKRKGPLTGNPTPRIVDPYRSAHEASMPRSCDVYYANDGKAVGQALPGQAPAKQSAVPAQQADAIVILDGTSTLRQRMEIALDRVRLGYIPVRVSVADRELLKAARQFIEMAVTREEISEDQGRDVVFGMLPVAQQTVVQRTSEVPVIEKLLELENVSAFAPEVVAAPAPTPAMAPVEILDLKSTNPPPAVAPQLVAEAPADVVSHSDDDSAIIKQADAAEPAQAPAADDDMDDSD